MKSPMHFIGSSRHGGFTLIELMVVVAIIAILAAILFPVFGRARDKAFQTTCINNQRSLALAVIMYVQDHDETFPGYRDWAKDISVTDKVFDCPASSRIGTVDDPDYAYNRNLANAPIGDLGAAQITEVTIDSPGLAKDNMTASLTTILEGDFRHSGNIVISYADGHVQLLKSSAPFTRDMAPYAMGRAGSGYVKVADYTDAEQLRIDLSKHMFNWANYNATYPNVLVPIHGRLYNGQWILDGTMPGQTSIDYFWGDMATKPSVQTNFANATQCLWHFSTYPGYGTCQVTMDFDITYPENNTYVWINGDPTGATTGTYSATSGRPGAGVDTSNLMRINNTTANNMVGTSVLFGDMGDPTKGYYNGAVSTDPNWSWDLAEEQRGSYQVIGNGNGLFTGGVVDFIVTYTWNNGYVRNVKGNPIQWGTSALQRGPSPTYNVDIALLTRDGREFAFKGIIPAHYASAWADTFQPVIAGGTAPYMCRFAINAIGQRN